MGSSMSSFLNRFFSRLESRILMVGLDAAGKTTILYYFKLNGEQVHTLPTIGFNVETVEYKNLQFTIWDIGGQDRIRALWRLYYQETEGMSMALNILSGICLWRFNVKNFESFLSQ